MDQEVARLVRDGWAIESRTDTQVVLVKKQRMGWFWNTVLTLLTGGIWLIVVAFKLLGRKTDRRVVTLATDGAVSVH